MYQKLEDLWGTVKHVRSLKNDLLLCLVEYISHRFHQERLSCRVCVGSSHGATPRYAGSRLPADSMVEIDSTNYHDFVIKDGRFIGEFEQMYRKTDDPWGTVRHVNSLKNDVLLVLLTAIQSSSTVTKILHAGCGLGALTARMRATLGSEIWACDISETAIRRATALNPGIHFFVHDLSEIERLEFKPQSFDLIVMAETM